jgi:Na+/proline symporter/signal transduction histidine kinase
MVQGWAVIATAFIYLFALFAVASYGDRRRGRQVTGRANIYAFSLAIYCTTWTFFGSVGLAASSGLAFLAIYAGPIIFMVLGFGLLSRIVRLSKEERITSVADFLGSRYGKSMQVAGVACVIAVIGTVPYIALQLKAISSSVSTLISHYSLMAEEQFTAQGEISILIAITLAAFTILFGTRHADATEHQDGLMLAVALESVVKLAAFLCVGLFVTHGIYGGFGPLYEKALANQQVQEMVARGIDWTSFTIMSLLSLLVFILLPRQFHVTVVENHSEDELRRGRLLFPLYLVAINIFVLPIAAAGLIEYGNTRNADSFVLLLPMASGNDLISMFAFLGGLSAGAAMVVVACVALAIMISNDLVLPILLRRQAAAKFQAPANMEQLILKIRRSAILVILFLAYLYYRAADNTQALASIGLVSFAAIAQLAPAFFGGLFWSGANARGAIAGMTGGFLVWSKMLLLPTLLDDSHWLISATASPLPQIDLGLGAFGNGVVLSLCVNAIAFILVSLSRRPSTSEQTQALVFVGKPVTRSPGKRQPPPMFSVSELVATVGRYLGAHRAERSFEAFWVSQGSRPRDTDPVDPALLAFSEQLLASAIGASSSRLVHTLLLRRFEAKERDNIELLDVASQALQHHRDVLQTALDQVDQAITVFDANLRLSFWNRRFRRLLDLPPELGNAGTPLSQIMGELVSAQSLARQGVGAEDLERRIIEGGEPWLLALSAMERIVEIRTSPMPGGGIVVTWHDITERILVAEALREANETLERRVEERTSELVKANQQLERATRAASEANASKTRFLAAAGHDILQPLNAAKLYTSTLLERSGANPDGQLAANIGKSLESVEDILGAILAISRLDTGRQETKVAAVALGRIFEQMSVEFAPFAAERGVGLRILETSLWVNSDPALLRRLLQNLISNAIKYTPKGRVVVGCRRRGDKVLIEVIDTGIGIPKEEQKNVFAEFRRLEAGARHASGLGLGLSIVERISRVLGHRVELASLTGKGTRFTIETPRAKPDRQHKEKRAAAPAAMRHPVEGMRVIVVDNDPSILDGMQSLLAQWGCKVATAVDLAGALTAAAAIGGPDIVLADYHLERETGLDVIDALRKEHGAALPCALVTADRTAALRGEAEVRNVTVLNKPVRPAALRAVLSVGRQARPVAAE